MQKGSLGKITGPCINVPASLEPITEVLPRIPEDTQLVIFKLKRMLVYKSHYLCDYMHPQIVMNALRWLKVNNPHYQDVKVDENWPEKLNEDRVYKNISNNSDSEESAGEDCEKHCKSDDKNESLTQDEIDEDGNSEDEDEKTDEEMEEAKLRDQVQLDRKATVTVEGSFTCLQIDDLEEAVFSIAPGQNSVQNLYLWITILNILPSQTISLKDMVNMMSWSLERQSLI